MSVRKAIGIAFLLVFTLAVVIPVARADVSDQETQFTFSQSVQIPGDIVLPAGTYTFMLANSTTNKHIVRIFDADRDIVATILTISTERLSSTGSTVLQFAEAYNEPPALLTWYYSDMGVGHEFVYSGQKRRAFSEEPAVTVIVESAKPQSRNLSARTNY